MSMMTSFTSLLFSDIRTTLISVIVGYVVYKLAKFYVKVFSLPPGPIPLPLIGNNLKFRGTKQHWTVELERIVGKYGPITTIWMGSRAQVVISDIDIGREAFRKNDIAGRTRSAFSDSISNDKYTNVSQADYGHRWEALRRVTHSAIQKLSTSDKLSYLVVDCVDHTIKTIIDKEGFDKEFIPSEYIYNTFLNIIASSAFGKRYELDDPEYKYIKYVMVDLLREAGFNLMLWESFPFIKRFDPKFKKIEKCLQQFIENLNDKYQSHYKDYDETVVRDFCDTLITAKNEALREGKESAPYLTDANLSMALFDMFFAGTNTSKNTFRWALLHMLYDKVIEKKLREEIENEIGDRIPTHEDRNRCHYVMAFLSEVLRFSNIVSSGVQHKALVTTKIGDYTIPENTEVVVFQGHILHKEEYWTDPQQFKPERFLDSNGKYLTTRPKAFIPFGVGRRVCLGEKLAIADLFLVLVRFLQKTNDYEIVLHMTTDDNPLQPDPNLMGYHPKPYKISFNKRN